MKKETYRQKNQNNNEETYNMWISKPVTTYGH